MTRNCTKEDKAYKEKVYNSFLSMLEPYELHWLLKNELEFHDSYVNGYMSYLELEQALPTREEIAA